jgi:hypothetical protein
MMMHGPGNIKSEINNFTENIPKIQAWFVGTKEYISLLGY